MTKVVVLLESMWGWGGFNDAGEEAPRSFIINPDNHSGCRLYRMLGDIPFVVTNCCRYVQQSANDHGKPDASWVEENLKLLQPFGLLLVCGRIARQTFETIASIPGGSSSGKSYISGIEEVFSYQFMDHPAARRWSNEKLDAMTARIRNQVKP